MNEACHSHPNVSMTNAETTAARRNRGILNDLSNGQAKGRGARPERAALGLVFTGINVGRFDLCQPENVRKDIGCPRV